MAVCCPNLKICEICSVNESPQIATIEPKLTTYWHKRGEQLRNEECIFDKSRRETFPQMTSLLKGSIPIEGLHDSHVGWQEQYNFSLLGNEIYFHATFFLCFCHPTWLPCKPSILKRIPTQTVVFRRPVLSS